MLASKASYTASLFFHLCPRQGTFHPETSLFTKNGLSEKTDDAGCDGSERHKQIKAIREEYNQKYRPMPAVTKDLPYQLAVGCDSMTMASLTKLFRD